MSDAPLIVECPCGVVIHEPIPDALIVAVRKHAVEVHGMELDDQQILDMAHPA